MSQYQNLIGFTPLQLISNTGHISIFGMVQQTRNFDGSEISDGKGAIWVFGVNHSDGECYYKTFAWNASIATVLAASWTVINTGFVDTDLYCHLDAVQSPNGNIWVVRSGKVGAGNYNIYMTRYNGSTWSAWSQVNTTDTQYQCMLITIGEEVVLAYGQHEIGTSFYKKFPETIALASIAALTENTMKSLGSTGYGSYRLKKLSSGSLIFAYAKSTNLFYRISPPVLNKPDLTGFASSAENVLGYGLGNWVDILELTDKRWLMAYGTDASSGYNYKISSDSGATWGTAVSLSLSSSSYVANSEERRVFEDQLYRVWYIASCYLDNTKTGTNRNMVAQVSGWTPKTIPTTTWS